MLEEDPGPTGWDDGWSGWGSRPRKRLSSTEESIPPLYGGRCSPGGGRLLKVVGLSGIPGGGAGGDPCTPGVRGVSEEDRDLVLTRGSSVPSRGEINSLSPGWTPGRTCGNTSPRRRLGSGGYGRVPVATRTSWSLDREPRPS